MVFIIELDGFPARCILDLGSCLSSIVQEICFRGNISVWNLRDNFPNFKVSSCFGKVRKINRLYTRVRVSFPPIPLSVFVELRCEKKVLTYIGMDFLDGKDITIKFRTKQISVHAPGDEQPVLEVHKKKILSEEVQFIKSSKTVESLVLKRRDKSAQAETILSCPRPY